MDKDNLITLGAALILLSSLDDGVAQQLAGEEGEEDGGHYQGRLGVLSKPSDEGARRKLKISI